MSMAAPRAEIIIRELPTVLYLWRLSYSIQYSLEHWSSQAFSMMWWVSTRHVASFNQTATAWSLLAAGNNAWMHFMLCLVSSSWWWILISAPLMTQFRNFSRYRLYRSEWWEPMSRWLHLGSCVCCMRQPLTGNSVEYRIVRPRRNSHVTGA